MNEGINLYGKTNKGKLELSNRIALEQWLKNLPDDEDIVCKFRVQKNYKTNRQLRLCYHCLRELSGKTGHSVEEMKVYLKYKSGLCFDHQIEGQQISICKSIADMTKVEISDFIFFMDKWALEHLNHPLLTYEDKQFLNSM